MANMERNLDTRVFGLVVRGRLDARRLVVAQGQSFHLEVKAAHPLHILKQHPQNCLFCC